MRAFFPSTSEAAQALSFWGVFAAGFVARPAGSVLFGHIADRYGRRPCLIATVTIMGISTVLIGCLPTYKHIGVAAPALLAVLRLIQGIAMGGEFGTSLVYLHEIAPARYKGASGASGFATAIGGIAVGVAVVMAVTGACSPAALDLYGWRVPFLIAAATAGCALLLRAHMPESADFVRAAENGGGANDASSSGPSSGSADDLAKAAEEGGAAATVKPAHQQQHKQQQQQQPPSSSGGGFSFFELLRTCWARVLLQFGFETSVSVCFWLCTAYLPSYFMKLGMPNELALGALLVNLVLMTPVIVAAGMLCDRPRVPRVGVAMVAYVGLAAVAVPMFYAFKRSWAACWLLQLVMMLLLAVVLGTLPVSMSMLYPPSVRTSGFNLAHNCAMSLMGGLAPTVVTAISLAPGSGMHAAAGYYMLAATLVSLAAGALIMRVAPEANAAPPPADLEVDL
jgi:MHS family proline/betaine transporter-like MFS transporter